MDSGIDPIPLMHQWLPGLAVDQVLFVMASAMVAGLARGFSGFGGALIFVPLAAAATSPQTAAAVLLVIDGVLTLGLLPDAWARANRREVAIMVTGALIGVPLGTAALALGDPLALRWLIAGVVLCLLLFLMSGWRYHGHPRASLTVATGGIAGIFSGVAQIGGPPVVAYWLGGAIPAATVRGNLVLYFALSTVISTLAYLAGGLLTGPVFALSVVVAPGYALGLVVGSRLFGVVSEAAFRRICFTLIALAALVSLPIFDN